MQQGLNVGSVSVALVLSAGVATLSVAAGFSPLVAAGVGTVTATFGCWTIASDR